MKHIMASLTIGTCLLLTSAGAVFAAPKSNNTGQPGAASGMTCGSLGATITPGHAASANGSPFNPNPSKPKEYAGNPGSPTAPSLGPTGMPTPGEHAVGSNANTFTAISEYDVACVNQTTRATK